MVTRPKLRPKKRPLHAGFSDSVGADLVHFENAEAHPVSQYMLQMTELAVEHGVGLPPPVDAPRVGASRSVHRNELIDLAIRNGAERRIAARLVDELMAAIVGKQGGIRHVSGFTSLAAGTIKLFTMRSRTRRTFGYHAPSKTDRSRTRST